jgi:hypothetical protein
MTGKLRHLGGGSYVVHGLDRGQVLVMEHALAAESARRAQPCEDDPDIQCESVTISDRSHPHLFAIFGEGRAQFILEAPQAEDVDSAEADAVELDTETLAEEYPFLKEPLAALT